MFSNLSDEHCERIRVAGERVPAGYYQHIGSKRRIYLEKEDALPGSLDGRVACYVPVQPWQAATHGPTQN